MFIKAKIGVTIKTLTDDFAFGIEFFTQLAGYALYSYQTVILSDGIALLFDGMEMSGDYVFIQIKVLKRVVYGFRDTDYFFLRIQSPFRGRPDIN